jgi:hypothetical protein
MMVDKVIEEGGLCARPGGFALSVRLPWYRSLPLSTVELVSLGVDGQSIPLDRIRFEVNGGTWALQDLPRLTDEVWFVLDSAQLNVADTTLRADTEHDVEVVLALYPPYIKGLRRVARWTRRMKVN